MANALVQKGRNELAAAKKRPGNALLDATRGALMGVTTDVLGYPVDLATMALRPMGYNVEKPVGGSDWLADRLTSPNNSLAETGARTLTGMLTPGPNELLKLLGVGSKAPIQELTTYHGSPHRINNVDEANPVGKFDMDKIGTGEGAQAYGHGIYLAEQPGTARTYQWMAPDEVRIGDERIVGKTGVEGRNDPLTIAWNEVTAAFGGQHENPFATAKQRLGGKYGPRNEASKQAIEVINDWQSKGATVQKGGHFYTVDLPDEHIAKMLDWDAPLSEQPEIVAKLTKAGLGDAQGIFTIDGHVPYDSINGSEAYRQLMWQANQVEDVPWAQGFDNPAAAASAHLNTLGIPGIKYFDGGSRAAGEGTRNFVIFDGDTAKILKRE
jgi:hypothetical protein